MWTGLLRPEIQSTHFSTRLINSHTRDWRHQTGEHIERLFQNSNEGKRSISGTGPLRYSSGETGSGYTDDEIRDFDRKYLVSSDFSWDTMIQRVSRDRYSGFMDLTRAPAESMKDACNGILCRFEISSKDCAIIVKSCKKISAISIRKNSSFLFRFLRNFSPEFHAFRLITHGECKECFLFQFTV